MTLYISHRVFGNYRVCPAESLTLRGVNISFTKNGRIIKHRSLCSKTQVLVDLHMPVCDGPNNVKTVF